MLRKILINITVMLTQCHNISMTSISNASNVVPWGDVTWSLKESCCVCSWTLNLFHITSTMLPASMMVHGSGGQTAWCNHLAANLRNCCQCLGGLAVFRESTQDRLTLLCRCRRHPTYSNSCTRKTARGLCWSQLGTYITLKECMCTRCVRLRFL